MTIEDAAHNWVREFNEIDADMIKTLAKLDPDDYWEEVSEPAVGDRVYAAGVDCKGEITEHNGELYTIEFENGETRSDVREEQIDIVLYDDDWPVWGYMWSFGDSLDDYWLEEQDGISKMCDCGFRVYHSEKYGYFFGIDGGGYDFYEAHWIPLYKARGLQWHDEEEAESA